MKPARLPSVTLRLTLLFAGASIAVLLLLGLVVGRLADHHFEEMDSDLLHGKLELVRLALAHTATPGERAVLPARLDAALVGHHGLSVRIFDTTGQTVYVSAHGDLPARAPSLPAPVGPVRATGRDGHALRVLTAQVVPAGGPAFTVELASDLDRHAGFTHTFQLALWATVGVAALASGLLGWFAARRGLAPLREISRNAENITASRLGQRLPTKAIPAELAEVVHTFNAMLGRLETSFERLSHFASDLAHELRTPVSNLLTQTQVTLSQARDAETYREVLASNAEELERLSRTIADMLFLAKADHDLVVPNRETVDLAAEAASLIEFYEALAEENGVALQTSGSGTVAGDRLMLRRALANLLSNALRYTPRGGRIDLRIACLSSGSISVRIENTGTTIPPEQLPRLFDRFYRADPARRRDTEGAGLGLAITRAIVQAHGGDIAVRSSDGVTTFELRLPTATA